MSSLEDLTHAQACLLLGGRGSVKAPSKVVTYILRHGWAAATTRQYAAAVNKFRKFTTSLYDGRRLLPTTSQRIYHFILWCSASKDGSVSSGTIKRYLTGLRMWHTLHGFNFPAIDPHRIRLLLKACGKTEIKKQQSTQTGLLLRDVVGLTDHLLTGNKIDLVTRAIILVGFWGLARLGELTLHPDHPLVFVRRRDVSFSKDGKSVELRLRLAKTAKQGEFQSLRLREQPNRLDPVNVIHEVIRELPGQPDDPLFPGRIRSTPIDRRHVISFLRANGPQDGAKWSGHSLHIGGASFQHHTGRPLSSLKRLGRWRSSAYKTYVHKYSKVVRLEKLALSSALHF